MSEYLQNEKVITLIKATNYFQKNHAGKIIVDMRSGVLKIEIISPLINKLNYKNRLLQASAKKNFCWKLRCLPSYQLQPARK